MSECTFRPRIKELPAQYGAQKRPREAFVDRVERWRVDRDRALEKLVVADAESALGECTFQPRISSNSRKAAVLSRSTDGRSADQRLYDDDKSRRAARQERLGLDSSLRESRFADEHPFRPALVAARDHSIKPRYRQQQRPPAEHARYKATEECTFAPTVNGVRDDMALAKRYLSSGVFDRLAARRARTDEPTHHHQSDDVDQRSTATRADLDSFLKRQAAFDAKRRRRVDDLRASAQPAFRPALVSSRSVDASDFMDRLAVAARRRQRRSLDSASLPARRSHADAECTFSPAISDLAARRARRSVDELSTGDALRQETSRRLLQLRAEHDHKRAYSFKPDLVATATRPHAQSKLRVSSAPDTYLDRLRRENERRLEHQRRQQHEQDRRLLQDATFEPRTTKCPTYIKRIARGMALAKMAEQARSVDQPPRPDWR